MHVTPRLAALVRRELIRSERAIFAGDDGFRFRHLLIRDAAYDALAKTTRAELHGRFADWLDEHGDALVERDEIVGYHLEQAYEYLRELGPPDQHARSIAVRAESHLASAGKRAFDGFDVGAAANLLARAVALHDPADPVVSLRLNLSGALYGSGRLTEAVASATDASELAAAAGDRLGSLRAQLLAARQTLWSQGSGAAALLELMKNARPAFERAGDEFGMAEVCRVEGELEGMHGHLSVAAAAFEEAADYARRAGDRRQELENLAWAAMARATGLDPVPEALERLDRQPPEVERHHTFVGALRAMLEAMLGRFGEARGTLADADQRSNELGTNMGGWRVFSWAVEKLAGDDAAAEREARRGCDGLERIGEASIRSTLTYCLADSLCALGRFDEAEQTLALADELSMPDDIDNEILMRRVRGRLLARRGEHERAEKFARDAVAIAEQTDKICDHAEALTDLAEVLELARHSEDATAQLQKALALYKQKGNIVMIERTNARLTELTEPSTSSRST